MLRMLALQPCLINFDTTTSQILTCGLNLSRTSNTAKFIHVKSKQKHQSNPSLPPSFQNKQTFVESPLTPTACRSIPFNGHMRSEVHAHSGAPAYLLHCAGSDCVPRTRQSDPHSHSAETANRWVQFVSEEEDQ